MGRGKYWTDSKIERLKELYPNKTNKEISELLMTTKATVADFAYKLKLRKSKSHITEIRRESVKKRHQKEVAK